ncbi:hypothetical protein CRG98_001163 [Punica granatum]|uniref:OVATE domain-containing protein n=1 Tax=Punica granatum TaxID=22663 RepID=A0A2I0LCP8_PUNGR|nr:hypothetical protein CRG98_001163 [Punica granatum]
MEFGKRSECIRTKVVVYKAKTKYRFPAAMPLSPGNFRHFSAVTYPYLPLSLHTHHNILRGEEAGGGEGKKPNEQLRIVGKVVMGELGYVQETKKYSFPKTLRGLKSFLYKRCRKLPRSSLLRPFSCSRTRQKLLQAGQHKARCPYGSELDMHEKMRKDEAMSPKDQRVKGEEDEDVFGGSFMKFARPCLEDGEKERKVEKMGSCSFRSVKGEDGSCEDVIEEKMRELELMDLGDLENVLDMEEALHYYSRLSSPVLLGIVNRFLMDIYSDYSVPETSTSFNRSKKRFGSTRL